MNANCPCNERPLTKDEVNKVYNALSKWFDEDDIQVDYAARTVSVLDRGEFGLHRTLTFGTGDLSRAVQWFCHGGQVPPSFMW